MGSSRRYDGTSASALASGGGRGSGGISLEAGLPNDVSRGASVASGKSLVILGNENGIASPHPDPSSLAGSVEHPAAGRHGQQRTTQAGGSSKGEATVETAGGKRSASGRGAAGEARHIREAHVAATLVSAGGERREAGVGGGEGAGKEGESTMRRSVPPPLRLDNGTLVLADRLGLRPSGGFDYDTASRSGATGDDDDCDDDNDDSSGDGSNSTSDETARRVPITVQIRRKRESLEEWATAARKRGRVDPPASTTPSSSAAGRLDHQIPGGSNNKNTKTNLDSDSYALPTLHDLKSARARAHKALLTGNVTGTLEMCQQILHEWPSDGTTLLYQGAALAQSGEWDIAWEKMERVLALSCGVVEIPTAETMATATTGGYTPDEGADRGSARDSKRVGADVEPDRAADLEVPLDITLAAAANLASFARARAPETLDQHAEMFFLIEGLRGAAERDRVAITENMVSAAVQSSSLPASKSVTDGRASVRNEHDSDSVSVTNSSSLDANDRTGDDVDVIGGGNKSKRGQQYYEISRIDGFTDQIVMMAQALEGKGQLTSALRLYQRAILLGSHRDQRALHGLGGLSRRLIEAEREITRTDRPTTALAETSAQLTSITPSPYLPTSSPPGNNQREHQPQTSNGSGSSSTSEPGTAGAAGAASARRRRQQTRRGGNSCEWSITHPRPDQVFSPEDLVRVEFDLTLLDPGLPATGSLFETLAVGGGAGRADGVDGGLPSAGYVQEGGGRGRGIDVVEDSLGVLVCSYLDVFEVAHCLPRGQLQDIGLGWHLLTAEAYRLPSLAPFSCPGGSGGATAGDDGGEYRCEGWNIVKI